MYLFTSQQFINLEYTKVYKYVKTSHFWLQLIIDEFNYYKHRISFNQHVSKHKQLKTNNNYQTRVNDGKTNREKNQ